MAMVTLVLSMATGQRQCGMYWGVCMSKIAMEMLKDINMIDGNQYLQPHNLAKPLF